MAYCPSCGVELAADASQCAGCGAVFDKGASWKPLAEPPVPEPPSAAARVFAIIFKGIVVLVSLAALGLGGLVASAERNSDAAAAMVLVGFVVIAIAITSRLRWSFLALCVAIPVGLATCAANFKWHGG